jgi:glutamyl-tRNA synthetase
MGYLPAALRNYLVRLGWSHGDQEIFSDAEMIEFFDLPEVGRSAARFDFAKLESLNGHYMRATPDEELVKAIEALLPHIEKGDEIAAKLDAPMKAKLIAAMPGLKERAKTLLELISAASFLWADRPLTPEDEKAKALLGDDARALLGDLIPELQRIEPWNAEQAEAVVRGFAERKGVKLGSVAQPLRVALTGRTTSPGIFDVLTVLGQQESVARLQDQVKAPA